VKNGEREPKSVKGFAMPTPQTVSAPQPMRPLYDDIIRLTDAVCRDHIDPEFALMCRKGMIPNLPGEHG
jgi:hypothetical protein